MTDRHMVIKTLLMQNMGSAHYLPVLHNAIQAHVISIMLLLPICLSVCSMNSFFGLLT